MDLDQIQLNKHLCTYLRKRLRKTRNVLEDRTFIRRARNSSQQRALTEVDLVMTRAEELESKCMCKQSSWLDAAITLADIKEEVLEIVLDLCFWTSMLKIAVADSDTEESKVVRSTAKAVKKHEDLLQKLLEEGSSLQKAASDDRDHLLAKLEKVKKEHASRSTGDEYILSLYLWSRIKGDDQFAANVESKQLMARPGNLLGSGASGNVTEATWLDKKCALKVLKVVDEKEATILRGCNHPHIVRFLWYWEHQRKSHIVMEWMPTDLSTHIERQVEKNGGKPFQLHVAIDIMLQIAKAMRYLHSKKPRKIVHRDLKTSNILVQPNINNAEGYVLVKLADFGTSKFYNRTETPSLQTSEKGTTMYAAPEVFKQKPVRANNTSMFPPKADVWSFAMVCSEILTGEVPFNGIPRATLHDEIKKSGIRPDLPPDCPRTLHFCITSCWAQNPKKRPTFVEVCKMLKLAKAAILGIICLDVHKLLFSPNHPTLANPKNRLDLNMPLSSLLAKKFLHFGWTKRKTLVGLPSTTQPLHTTLYSYKKLKIATNNFNEELKLGHGGFGVVYKGVLPDGEQVAVKCLYISSNVSDDEFWNEVGIMGRISHRNIVEFKGYCLHAKRKFLVHEFVENGSLAEILFEGKGNHVMDWPTRQNICLEVANGLQYLHEGVQPLIIHRDIKTSNILLDKDLHAKIADFGIATIFNEDEPKTTTFAGTVLMN
ncbi:hypothetical protein CY35_15G004200 [Sphagnum magellanicum]|nr:hypothetical protein CY35_15G004200 [Sphagnum magellanicum]